MEKLFHLKENGTNVKTEVMAGITTFLAMAYILAVNPSMLGDAGMNSQGVFMATALAAAVATIVMALLANYPIALASGMGLNAYFAYTICLGELADQANPWQIALTAILVEGIIFIILSAFKFRETLVNCIPENLKYGITTGIGLFITFIGLQNAGIAAADASTKVALGDIAQPQVALALIGVIIIGLMLYFNVKGAILWGILITWGLGIIAQFTGWYAVNPEAGVYSLLPSGSFLPNFAALGDTAFKFDFSFMLNNTVEFAVIVFAFLFVDLFDTVGTLIGVAAKGNMLDKDGKLPRVGRALMADAIGTVLRGGKPGIDQRFFEMGLSSLDLVTVQNLLEGRLHTTIPLMTLLEHTTIRSLAAWVDSQKASAGPGASRTPEKTHETVSFSRGMGRAEQRMRRRMKGRDDTRISSNN